MSFHQSFAISIVVTVLLFFSHSVCVSGQGFVDPNISLQVVQTLLQPDGKILICGRFSSVAGQTRKGVARLSANGTLDTSFPDPGLENFDNVSVFACALQSDGKIVIGGNFTSVAQTSSPNIARLNSNGTLDPSFSASTNGAITAIGIQADGKVIVGGDFTLASGISRIGLARFNTDGSLDQTFSAPAIVDLINAIVPQPDGRILVGGWFDTSGPPPLKFLVRLDQNGTVDSSFQISINGPISKILLVEEGKILICGFFGVVNGTPQTVIARLNPNGSLDTSLRNIELSGNITSFAVQADGKIIVGGSFSNIGGQERRDLARLNSDGSYDDSFVDVNANFGGSFSNINSIVVQPDSKILISGQFSMIGHQSRRNLVRLLPDGTLDMPPAQTVTVTKSSDTNDGVCNADCSLREAIFLANNSAQSTAIEFASSVFGSPTTIALTNGELVIQDGKRVFIAGPGSNLLTISGGGNSRIFNFRRDSISTLSGVTLTAANGVGEMQSGQGGAILVGPNGVITQVSISNVVINNCTATNGGAIRGSGNVTLDVSSSSLINNSVNDAGGAVNFTSGILSFRNTTIAQNRATHQNSAGGGIRTGASILTFVDSVVADNSANSSGGIDIGGRATLTESTISGNTSNTSGGGIGVATSGNATLTNTNVTGNSSTTSNGGGIYNLGRVTINDSSIAQNSANFGGGVFTLGGFAANSSTLTGNRAASSGGGIYNNTGGSGDPVVITSTVIKDNSSGNAGGGIYNRDRCQIVNSTLTNNSAPIGGGGIFNVFLNVGAAELTVTGSTFNENSTNAAGGALANQTGIVTIMNTTISNNFARGVGGGIQSNSNGRININFSTITLNRAQATSGGGINNGGSTVTVENTIVSANRAGASELKSDIGGTIVSNGYNLIEAVGDGTITGVSTGNILGVEANLGPLNMNGGDTLTHLPTVGSPAIDAGSAGNIVHISDQRGLARPYNFLSIVDAQGGNGSDIGATERQMVDAPGPFVKVEGRILTPQGLALRNAIVSIIDSSGVRRNVTTSSFGIFIIEGVTVGGTYTITVNSKRYRFSPRSVTVATDLNVGDIIGLE